MKCIACNYDPDLLITHTDTVILDHAVFSLNTTGTNTKNNRAYRKQRKTWARLLLREYSGLKRATAKRRISITRLWGKGKRAYDYGNLVGGLKPLLDEIVRAGLLLDDSPKCCADYYYQYKAPDGIDRVVIVLEDCEDLD